jgi:FAD/FMN-containing dehydrogenase
MSATLLASLRKLLGEAQVLHDGDLSAWEVDWRKRYRGKALAVIRPASTDQVAQAVTQCAAQGVSIVPQGGNTGLVGGGVPNASGTQIVLSLQRMNRVRAIDADNLTMTVDAGCVLQAVQEAARSAGFWFPLSLAAEGSCTIGGNLATNAGGTQVLRFGNARDLCLGLEVVTPHGDIWHGLSGLRKDNTGYDLRHLMIGSEGTLGIITGATLKLAPQPAASMTAMATCPDLPACVSLLSLARQRLGDALTGFEVMNHVSLALVAQHMPQLRQPLPAAPWSVLLELSDPQSAEHARAQFEALLEAALAQQLIDDAAVAQSVAQSKTMWHLRESIPLAQAEEGLNIKHDVSLPVSRIAAFCAEAQAALTRDIPGSRLVNFGHLGDGNLHFNVQAPVHSDAAAFLAREESRVNTIVYDCVVAHGGSISAEHGVGALKVDELAARKDATALSMMRAVKAALDPQGLMNPGRVIQQR